MRSPCLIFFCLCLFLNVSTCAYAEQAQTFTIEPDLSSRSDLSQIHSDFSKEEISWMKSHPLIRVGGESDWAPFDFVDTHSKYNGISRVFLQMIANRTHLRFRVEINQWDVLLDKIKNKQIDLLPVVYYSKHRSSYINFTAQPYQKVVDYLFVRDDSNLATVADLNGKTVAIPRGYATIKRIKAVFPEIKVLQVGSPSEAVNAVITYQADILYDSLTTMSYFLQANGITSIKPLSTLQGFAPTPLYMGTRKDWVILSQILNKVLLSIPLEEKNRLLSVWKPEIDKTTQLHLSEQQKQWLVEHPLIRFAGDPDWLPFEGFNQQGEYVGIVAEYLALIEKILGIEFKKIQTASWAESIQHIKNGSVDVLSETVDSDLSSDLVFTKPYLNNPVVIVMRNSQHYVESLNDIENKKIAIIKDYGYVSRLKKRYPKIDFIEVNDIGEGLLGVSSEKIDAMLCTIALCSYTISAIGLNQVKIVGKTGITTQLGFGIQKELEPLVDIFNQAIELIDQETQQLIMKKWIKQKYIEKIDYTLIWQILAVSIVILGIILYWNRKLMEAKKQITSLNKKMHDSIEYASLIQQTLIPDHELFKQYSDDYFVIWKPRDVVGGDIYFLESISEDEMILMVIDCTGHGIPGAFVTMLVKAIERQMIARTISTRETVSPANLLGIFNRSMKHLLKQEDDTSISNAGFDSGIVYYNRKKQVLKFAGAEIPLFIVQQGQVKVIKGDRQSIGYKKSKTDYQYTDHTIEINTPTSLYLSTDGFYDQNGGGKGFPFGKKRFKALLKALYNEHFEKQSQLLQSELHRYQNEYETNDDITVVGIKLA